MECPYRGCAAFCLAVMFSCLAHASVVFDNTSAVKSGADPVASPLYGYFGPLYDSFSTGADVGVLVDLQFVLSGTPDSGSIDIGLYSDADTSPGFEIVDFGTLYDTSLSSTPSIYEIATGDPVLAPYTRYWIGIRDNSATGITSAFWDWSTDTSGPGVDGEYFANADGVFADEIYGPYQMYVDPAPAPVSSAPEPGTIALLPLGVSLLLAFSVHTRRVRVIKSISIAGVIARIAFFTLAKRNAGAPSRSWNSVLCEALISSSGLPLE